MSILDVLSRAGTLEIVVGSIFIGVVIGACSLYYQKKVIGGFVRKLLSEQRSGPEDALTLEELGYGKNFFVRHALRDGSVLRKMVWEAEDEYTTDETGFTFSARSRKMDINTARFYIDERNRVKAELRYNDKGSDIFALLIGIIVFAVVAYALLLFVPYIMNLFSSLTSSK